MLESTAEGNSLRWADEDTEWLSEETFVEGGAEFGGFGGGSMAPPFEDPDDEFCSWFCWEGGGVMLGGLCLLTIGDCDGGTSAVTWGFNVTFL